MDFSGEVLAGHFQKEARMRVAILGMGKMGRALALRLLQAGYEISIWNRTKRGYPELTKAGARLLDNPSKSWDNADFVISFVSDDSALRSVYLEDQGVLSNSTKGVAIDMSTVSPEASAEIAQMAEARGVAFLRCPVSGNPQALAAGSLTIMASGTRSAFEKAAELLHAAGARVIYLGEGEQARIVKLAVNSMLAATAEMLAEVIVLCESNGIDRATVLNVISNSSVGSPLVAAKTPGLVNRNYEATFTTAMLLKDLRLMLDVARRSRIALPVTELATDLMAKTCDAGFAGMDFASLLPRLQAAVGQKSDLPISGF